MHRFRLPLGLLGAVLVLTLSRVPAQAQPGSLPEPPAAPAPAPRVRTERYGLMMAAVDAAGFVTSIATEEFAIAAGSYLLAGPIVHLFHRNYGTAVASIGLRSTLVLGGFFIGQMFSHCGWADGEYCTPDYRLHGTLIGAGSAVLLDWLWLAKTTTREAPEPPALLRAGSLRANPGVQMSRTGGVLLGLEGHF